MIIRIIKLVQNEIYKIIKQKITYFSVICGVGVVIFWGIGADYFFPGNVQPGAGFLFLLISTQSALNFLGVLLILIFCSMLISSESSSGTLQMMIVNPVSRMEFFSSKAIAGMIFSLILLSSILITSLILGGIHFGYGDYVEEGLILFKKGQIFLEIFYCFLIILFPLIAFSCYALLISVITNNVGYAIGVSIGSVIFLDIIREKLNLSPFLFQSYMETPFNIVKSITEGFEVNWKPEIFACIGVPLIWAIGCFSIGFFIFSKKDYKS
ncbi:MAG: ABC transporter permease [Promethearchaeota archaeon]|jgi:ABC-type transport system involved in multi-copper enzyme maturation permease subunit